MILLDLEESTEVDLSSQITEVKDRTDQTLITPKF